MFEAERHSKQISTQSEDFLTSSVFGLLRHIPPSFGLFPFLKKTRCLGFGEPLSLSYFDVDESCLQVDWFFWQLSTEKGVGEPDLILRLHGGGKEALLIIEVKYLSGKSGEGEVNDQLKRYVEALGARERRRFFPAEQIQRCDGPLLGLVYLTVDPAVSELQASRSHIKNADLSERLYGLTWRALHETLEEQTLLSRSTWWGPLLDDLKGMLYTRHLRPFSGWSLMQAKWLFSHDWEKTAFFEAPARTVQASESDFSGWGWLDNHPAPNNPEGKVFYNG
jgi:hypothetical protein